MMGDGPTTYDHDRDVREPLLVERVRDLAATFTTRLDRLRDCSCAPSAGSVGRWAEAAEPSSASCEGSSAEDVVVSHSGAEHRTRNMASSVGLSGGSSTAGISSDVGR